MLNGEAREELEGYADRLPFLVVGPDGELYEVDRITTSLRSEGVLVIVETGNKYEPEEV